MKKLILFSVSILLAGAAITAFVPADCVQQCLGTKTLYKPYNSSTKDIAPEGYEPVFVNYAGRHGARHMTSVNSSFYIKQLLAKAANENALTPKGKELQAMVGRFLVVEQPQKLGLLTQIGNEELYGIGNRMAQRFPSLFSQSGQHQYVVLTTKEERTRQSADHFMKGLGHAMRNNQEVHLDTMDNIHLRFYDFADAYRQFEKSGNWTQYMQRMETSDEGKKMNKEIIELLFTNDFSNQILQGQVSDTFKGKLATYEAAKINDAIFGMASITNAISKEITDAGFTAKQLDISSLFTCEEIKWLGMVNNADDFLKKAPGTDNNGIQVRDAVPLLVDFINTTDSFISTGRETAVLRFAHAETMAPLAALMDINGSSTATTDVFNIDKVWKANFTIPFGANLQWILYRNKKNKDDVLIKILYNEQPVRIPAATDMFPYYKWSVVRDYYINKLNGYHVGLSQDMQQYLTDLK
jgi:multiple inositol-polyphosphate phosphatase / 2,3-bisphosphoglycerate 3-phosphatase